MRENTKKNDGIESGDGEKRMFEKKKTGGGGASGGSRKFWWGGIIKTLSSKPQKFGCFHQN